MSVLLSCCSSTQEIRCCIENDVNRGTLNGDTILLLCSFTEYSLPQDEFKQLLSHESIIIVIPDRSFTYPEGHFRLSDIHLRAQQFHNTLQSARRGLYRSFFVCCSDWSIHRTNERTTTFVLAATYVGIVPRKLLSRASDPK